MLFNSWPFIILLAVTFILYYLPLFKKYQIPVIIASSLFFYAWHRPALLAILIASIFINSLTSWVIVHKNVKRRFVATLGVIFNIGLLIFYKYGPLLGGTFFPKGNSIGEFLLMIPLPIGISFYTFQGISLIVDVYSRRHFSGLVVVEKSFVRHLLRTSMFISFFAQLIAGPIVKAHDFFPQFAVKFFRNIDWGYCFRKLTLGYFLKMVVADNLKDYTFWISFPAFTQKSTLTLVTMLYGFSFQIFADFAGYSLIALGLAGLFGYRLMDNFNFPYIASTMTDAWRRWHISLSSFLREYLYFPLCGKKCGSVRKAFNLLLTMTIAGLWHGVTWNFALWGFIQGLVLVAESVEKAFFRMRRMLLAERILRNIFLFTLISVLWTLFILPKFEHSIGFLRSIVTNVNLPHDQHIIIYTALYSLPVVLYYIAYLVTERFPQTAPFIKRNALAYALLLFLIITNSGSARSFVYFQF
jgi:alginate O-acetyltransferase complex protein AlgI